jgi:hypothetical protein
MDRASMLKFRGGDCLPARLCRKWCHATLCRTCQNRNMPSVMAFGNFMTSVLTRLKSRSLKLLPPALVLVLRQRKIVGGGVASPRDCCIETTSHRPAATSTGFCAARAAALDSRACRRSAAVSASAQSGAELVVVLPHFTGRPRPARESGAESFFATLRGRS